MTSPSKFIEVSEDSWRYLKRLKGMVERKKGFRPSTRDLVDEILYEFKGKNIKLFETVGIAKIRKMKKIRTTRTSMPKGYVSTLKKLGFTEHNDVLYFRVGNNVVTVSKVGVTKYLVTSTINSVVYLGPLTEEKLVIIVQKAVRDIAG